MSIRTLALRSGETSAEDHRLLIGSLLGAADDPWPLHRRGGLMYASGAADLSGFGMTATIRPFSAAVTGRSSPLQGSYLVVSTEDVDIRLEDGPTSGSRTDVVGVVVKDDLYDDSDEVLAEIRVIDPEEDETYLPLFEIIVSQGASTGTDGISWPSQPGASLPSNIRDLRDYTSSAGGVVSVPSVSARNRMDDVRDGTIVHVGATRDLYIRDAGDWRPVAGPAADAALDNRYEPLGVPKILFGREYITPDTQANNAVYSTAYWRGQARVDFPEGYFRETPTIMLTVLSAVPGTVMEATHANSRVHGFDLMVARTNTTSNWVHWLAVGT
ncbi:hypothetical protein NE857_05525 [Nocardiopsis exhalans]|uniref:Uncharacterized protein n=1 Tax=Nocardiopsis exhalans TaxID=163604 RepID=A0ABY5DDE2_9ACTN|nr:hypothetical protein [Nocardiopsis exhalans]USY21101.1 hypothetical protein NE857_05525 [Nocardiopsis exhalans]